MYLVHPRHLIFNDRKILLFHNLYSTFTHFLFADCQNDGDIGHCVLCNHTTRKTDSGVESRSHHDW